MAPEVKDRWAGGSRKAAHVERWVRRGTSELSSQPLIVLRYRYFNIFISCL